MIGVYYAIQSQFTPFPLYIWDAYFRAEDWAGRVSSGQRS
jgi:hypothetical protein